MKPLPKGPEIELISAPVEQPARRIAYQLKLFAKMVDCDLSTLYRAARKGHLVIRKRGVHSIVLAHEGDAYLRSLPRMTDTALANAVRQEPEQQ